MLDDGPNVVWPRQATLEVVASDLPDQDVAVLLCAIRGERGIRPIISLPDRASVRKRMTFASVPDHLLRLVGSMGSAPVGRRINVNERYSSAVVNMLARVSREGPDAPGTVGATQWTFDAKALDLE